MKSITLSGWGQPSDALSGLISGSVAIDYAHAANFSEALRIITAAAGDAEIVVGWSLGGQLAARAVAAGMISPKNLILIATPYQFVADDIGRETFNKFYNNYKINPQRTLHKAWELLHYEDSQAQYISDQLASFDKDEVLKKDWLRWLALLAEFSCATLDFANFPRTLLVHGDKDIVVSVENSRRMAEKINDSRVEIWKNCGHAPHLHDAGRLRALINDYISGFKDV